MGADGCGSSDEVSTCRKFRQVRTEGNRKVARELPYYNLDMIISLGYRVKSKNATNFRRWANERLKEYMIKGFTMDDERLKNLSLLLTFGKLKSKNGRKTQKNVETIMTFCWTCDIVLSLPVDECKSPKSIGNSGN
ncbi:RhuM family protein [Anaerovoracaceae bacterium 42-11]